MTNGTHAPLSTPRARNGEPQPAPPPTHSEPATARRDLTSWWKQFKRGNPKKEEEKEPDLKGIFGVPLITSIPYANVAISLYNDTGESYIYGYVPIVVAKCGVFLKEKATDVEGIFRLAGSEKRIKELKIAFDTPPRWGKGLDWTGFTVHDAANILRRYFNQLPEPIIPLQYYDPFRQPLENHQAEAVGPLEGQVPSVGGFDPDAAVRVYQQLIKELPSLNRQLLLYILDLLAVFAAKSDVNKMTTSNLAAIFQPGILSHPQHDMSPQDYRLSQDVLIFLIDNQDHFLIGMEGTAVDEGTVKHVESGPSTPQARTPTTPSRNKSGLGRSASTSSSAAAESVRKFGGIRRNVSTSSRHSRNSGAIPSPIAQSFGTPTGSGVHRSNTLPSKKSPALPPARFAREKYSDPPTPSGEEPKSQPSLAVGPDAANTTRELEKPTQESIVPEKVDIIKPVPSEKIDVLKPSTDPSAPPPIDPALPSVASPPSDEATPTATVPVSSSAEVLLPVTPQLQPLRTGHLTPTRSEFVEGPVEASAAPAGEPAPAVRTFTQILSKVSPSGDEKKDGRKPNKLQKKNRLPSSANPSAHSSTHSLTGINFGVDSPPSPLPRSALPTYPVGGSKEVLQAYNSETVSSRNSGATLKPSMSPSTSFRSHSTATEYSEAEPTDEPLPPKEERRHFWKSHKRAESKATPTGSQHDLGQNPGADKSMSSFGSSGWGRRSLQYDSHQGSETSSLPFNIETKEHEKKGPLNWFREKRHERKEREAEKQRAKSPPGSTSDLGASLGLGKPNDGLAVRGKSMDAPRTAASEGSKGSSDITPTAVSPQPLLIPGSATPPTKTPSYAPSSPPTKTLSKAPSSSPAETPTSPPAKTLASPPTQTPASPLLKTPANPPANPPANSSINTTENPPADSAPNPAVGSPADLIANPPASSPANPPA